MSGILYPILILTLFLIVQILTMMASRKTVLDKNKQQLLDSVNRSNKIYNNEELSILFGEQSTLIQTLQSQVTDLKNKNSSLESTIASLTKADEQLRTFTTFSTDSGHDIVLKFERTTRGALLVSGSANGVETISNIEYNTYNDNFTTVVNNLGENKVKISNFSCTPSICTIQIELNAYWGQYFAFINTKFIS